MEMAKNAKVNVWVKENKQLYVIESIIRTFLIEETALGFRWCFLMWSLLLFFSIDSFPPGEDFQLV